jgi:hypothetical protein
MPLDDTRRNISVKDSAALEYHLAATAVRTETARKEKAVKAAIAVGVLFDHKRDPRKPGYEGVVYAGTAVLTLDRSSRSTTYGGPC